MMTDAIRFAALLCLLTTAGCFSGHRPTLHGRLTGLGSRAEVVAWSADGRLLAAADAEGNLGVWSIDTPTPLALRHDARMPRFLHGATALAFSPDASTLAFPVADGVVKLWQFRGGSTRDLTGHQRQVVASAFTPDGRQLATASGGLTYPLPPATVTPSTKATRGATVPPPPVVYPMTVITFDVATGRELSRVDASGMVNLTFSPGASLFAGSRAPTGASTTWPLRMNVWSLLTGCLQVRQTTTGEVQRELPVTSWFTQFSPDGRFLCCGATVWNLASGEIVQPLGSGIAVFTPDSARMIVLQAGAGLPSDWFLATTRWVEPIYVDLITGRRRELGRFRAHDETSGFDNALLDPSHYSPDRTLAVDYQLQIWGVPR